MFQSVDQSVRLLHDLHEGQHDEESQGLPKKSFDHQYPCPQASNNCNQAPASTSSWFLLLKVVVALLALWGLIDALRQAFKTVSTILENATPDCWCGKTDQEAIAMGCHYDHIAVDWLPSSCIDNELTEKFDASGPGSGGSWPYYKSVTSALSNGSKEESILTNKQIDEFAKHGKGYFATREWHIQHCMFIWKKQFRAGFNARHIEPWNNKEEHIQHCSDYIMQAVRWKLDLDVVDTDILGVNRHSNEQ